MNGPETDDVSGPTYGSKWEEKGNTMNAQESGTALGTPKVAGSKVSRRTKILIGIGTAAALAGAGGVATPIIVHATQVNEYTELHAQLVTTQQDTHETRLAADSSTVLATYQQEEAAQLGAVLEKFGDWNSTVMPASKKQLAEAGIELVSSLPVLPDVEPDIVADTRALIDELGEDDERVDLVPASWIRATIDDVTELRGESAVLAEDQRLTDDDVNAEAVAETREQLDAAQLELDTETNRLTASEETLGQITTAVAATLPAVNEVAEALPKQGKSFIKSTPKASKKQNSAVTAAAGKASEYALAASFESDEEGTIVPTVVLEENSDSEADAEQTVTAESVEVTDAYRAQITTSRITSYLNSAQAASKAHKKKVDAEKKAAAAAAAGGGGTGGSGGGSWNAGTGGGSWNGGTGGGWNNSGGWSGGSGGGSSSGGGGDTSSGSGGEGGGSSSGGGGGSSSGGGGGVSCPPPPAGWHATGSTGNGCPHYAPPGSGGADDW